MEKSFCEAFVTPFDMVKTSLVPQRSLHFVLVDTVLFTLSKISLKFILDQNQRGCDMLK